MADLVCVAFDDPDAADHVLTELNQLQKEFLVKLADACVVVRDGDGQVLGCQYHPEFLSRPGTPHPLFRGLIEAAQRRSPDQQQVDDTKEADLLAAAA